MSALDEAMVSHMQFIVNQEYRPFSYRDFLDFDVGGRRYSMTHGTFRNKISNLIKQGVTELSYRSLLSFYTLKGRPFGKPMTTNHIGVALDPLCRYLQNLPLGKKSLHDIHMKFKVPNIWKILSADSYTIDPTSKDIRFPVCTIGEIVLKTTIHRTDTVSIVVGCSYAPIPIDISGIIRLSNALAIVRDRILGTINDCFKLLTEKVVDFAIPEYSSWMVTMWHFGADGIAKFGGSKFCIWGKVEKYLIRIYSKEMLNGKTRVRLERQEYPKKSLFEAIQEKLESKC